MYKRQAQQRGQQSSEQTDRAKWIKEHYTKYEFLVPMRDGVKLFTQVYAPKDTTETYPFLINRTPYTLSLIHISRARRACASLPINPMETACRAYAIPSVTSGISPRTSKTSPTRNWARKVESTEFSFGRRESWLIFGCGQEAATDHRRRGMDRVRERRVWTGTPQWGIRDV